MPGIEMGLASIEECTTNNKLVFLSGMVLLRYYFSVALYHKCTKMTGPLRSETLHCTITIAFLDRKQGYAPSMFRLAFIFSFLEHLSHAQAEKNKW